MLGKCKSGEEMLSAEMGLLELEVKANRFVSKNSVLLNTVVCSLVRQTVPNCLLILRPSDGVC